MNAHNLRKGNVILYKGAPHRVLDFMHRAPGNKRAFVQTKLRNLFNGAQADVKFSSTEEVEEADVFVTKATYLYQDGDQYHFMKVETFDQFSMTAEELGEVAFYIQEQMEVEVTEFNGAAIGIVPPKTVILTVVDTAAELRGATATNSPKPAKTDTGLQLNVPAFVGVGEKIVVNTEEGTYVKRAE